MKSQEEINEQIQRLKDARENVTPMSIFGDDNLAGVDLQIRVLEEGLDEDDVYTEFGEGDESMNIRSYGTEATAWVLGESEYDDLVENLPIKK